MRIEYVALYVNDLEAARDFFTEILYRLSIITIWRKDCDNSRDFEKDDCLF